MSFTDSFLDFEAIKNWFENIPNPDMAEGEKVDTGVGEVDSFLEKYVVHEEIVEGSELIVDGSKSVANVEERECGMLENATFSIEDDMGKVSLVGEPVGDNGTAKSEIKDENGEKKETVSDEDESESSDSENATTSSSSPSDSSSNCSSSDDDDDNDDHAVEQEKIDKTKAAAAERKVTEASEVEEGEIRDIGGQDMANHEDGDKDADDVDAMVGWSDGDEDAGEDGHANPIRSKNEVKDLPHVPSVDAKLLPHHEMMPVGVVLSILGSQVIVEGIEKHNPLSDGSILWISESRSPLGFVDEIFGPVKHPYYVVRYNSEDEVPAGISTGTLVSFVPEFASHVLNNQDIYKKGYDASGANDEELSDEEEFSDDEKESVYKRMLKTAKRGTNEQQQPRSGKNNKRNAKNRGEPWKNGNPSPQQMPNDAGHMPPKQNQPLLSPLPAMADPGSFSTPFIVGGTGLVPLLPPLAQAACLNSPSNVIWANSMPFQPPQGAFFTNGFPMNNMPWPSQNPHQYPYRMPMPSGMPYDQQVNLNPGVLSGQPNTFAGFPYAQGHMGQNNFGPIVFGMGTQGQPSSQPGLNGEEQGNTSHGVHMGQSFNAPQSGGIPGNNDAPQRFNQGPSGCGRGSYRRGGGRFPRGRGRRQ